MRNTISKPDLNFWKIWDVAEEENDYVFLFWAYRIDIGFAISLFLLIVSWGVLHLADYPIISMLTIFSREWWGVFEAIACLCLVFCAHELLHAIFSNHKYWKFVRFSIVKEYGAFATHIYGENSKVQSLIFILAPLFIISGVGIPLAVYCASPLIMFVALVNLSGAGVDIAMAISTLMILKSDRTYVDGENIYIPR
jgi:hypothetical protein